MKPVKSGYLITSKINMEFSKLEHSYTVGKGSQLGREILFVFFKCLRSSCWTIRNKTVFLALIKVLIGPSYYGSFGNEFDLECL